MNAEFSYFFAIYKSSIPYHLKLILLCSGCFSASVIETSLDEEQSPSRVILELPTESHSSHDEEMIFEYDRMDETVSKLEHGSLLRCLNVPKISKTIKDIIEHKQPKFRYIIGKSTANITNEKLKDPRGNTTINELAKFFMNTDME